MSALKGVKLTAEHKRKIGVANSVALRGRKLSLQHKQNIRRDYKVRFFANIEKTDSCWYWLASKASKYGVLCIEGKDQLAHRVSWEIHNGEIPRGMCVLHHCDTPKCVNPEHLFLGTKAENNTDRCQKGRNAPRGGVLNTRALFTEKQAQDIRGKYSDGDTLVNLAHENSCHIETIRQLVKFETYKEIK